MSKVLCFEACSLLRCPLPVTDNTISILPLDASKFSLPLDSHVYLMIEHDGVREEVRFNGGPTYGGLLTIDRGTSRSYFPIGASVCVAITCGFLDDFVCQRVLECATPANYLNTLLLLDNSWSGTNTFLKPTYFGTAKWDPALVAASRLLQINSGLWANFTTGIDEEQYGYLASIERVVGNKATYGARFGARLDAGVTGAGIGSRAEVTGDAGAFAPLTGNIAFVFSRESNNTLVKNGFESRFSNRPEGSPTVTGGLGANKYNQKSSAYAVLSAARSSAGEFCGWTRGVNFTAGSLDETAGAKAVGIDFSEIGSAEVTRIDSWIRLRPEAGIEWNGDSVAYDKLNSTFYRATSKFEFSWKGNSRFGFKADNGTLLFADTAATVPLLVMSAGTTSGKFLPIEVNGTVYKIELKNV